MGLINFFSINFLLNSFSIFSWSNCFKSVFLNPNKLTLFEISIPFAAAKAILTPEKLPGFDLQSH